MSEMLTAQGREDARLLGTRADTNLSRVLSLLADAHWSDAARERHIAALGALNKRLREYIAQALMYLGSTYQVTQQDEAVDATINKLNEALTLTPEQALAEEKP